MRYRFSCLRSLQSATIKIKSYSPASPQVSININFPFFFIVSRSGLAVACHHTISKHTLLWTQNRDPHNCRETRRKKLHNQPTLQKTISGTQAALAGNVPVVPRTWHFGHPLWPLTLDEARNQAVKRPWWVSVDSEDDSGSRQLFICQPDRCDQDYNHQAMILLPFNYHK